MTTNSPTPAMRDNQETEQPRNYVIWSHRNNAWWAHAMNGYTADLLLAGLYTQAEALDIERTSRLGEEAMSLESACALVASKSPMKENPVLELFRTLRYQSTQRATLGSAEIEDREVLRVRMREVPEIGDELIHHDGGRYIVIGRDINDERLAIIQPIKSAPVSLGSAEIPKGILHAVDRARERLSAHKNAIVRTRDVALVWLCDHFQAPATPGQEVFREVFRELLAECRDVIASAVFGEDGIDDDCGLLDKIGDTLGDKDDWDASQKCSDDPCERCGGDGIRHTLRHGYAKYEGLCDTCFESPARARTEDNSDDAR